MYRTSEADQEKQGAPREPVEPGQYLCTLKAGNFFKNLICTWTGSSWELPRGFALLCWRNKEFKA